MDPSLHGAVRTLLEIDHHQGGAAAAFAARPIVRTAYRRLAGPRPRRDVVAGVGELFEVYGWFLHDAGRPRAAYRMSRLALDLLRRSGHRSLELLTVQNLALQAQTQGRPDLVLELVRPVTAGSRPSGWLAALFLAREAQALAQTGQRALALRTFARARSSYLDGPSTTDPEWATWVDPRQFSIFEAMTWSALGAHDRAAGIFAESLTGTMPARNRYSLSGYLLTALVHAGDWRGAADLIPGVLPQVDRFAVSRDSGVLWRATTEVLRRRTASGTGGGPKPGLTDAAVQLRATLSGRRYGELRATL